MSLIKFMNTSCENKHMHSHYEPGGFPRIWAASAFTPSLKQDTDWIMDNMTNGLFE